MPKEKSPDPVRKHPPVTPDSTIQDVISHPAFRGFGRFILPLDRGTADLRMPLSRMGTLLPYHSHVNPEKAVEIINRMVEEAGTGRQIFYSFYSGKQKRQDASRENTGLFFFRGKPGAPFAVICPGGGFSYVGSIHEGFPHALELSRKGYNAFVLQYRTGSGAWACEDLAAAISYIFRNAVSLNVGTADYSVWGSSSGARMVAAMGSCGPSSFGYRNERGVGSAVKKSGIPRGEIWITSKLWPTEYGEDKTMEAIDKMLARLQTDYIDLLYVYQPVGDFVGAWKDMERAVEAGKVRALGISNFDASDEVFRTIMEQSRINPAVLQIECHPYAQCLDIREKVKAHGIQIEFWFPPGGAMSEGALLKDPAINKIAKDHGKTAAQVILRWHIQENFSVIPGASNPDYIRENIDIFAFELSGEEMAAMRALNKGNASSTSRWTKNDAPI